MNGRSNISAKLLIGGIFTFNGAIFAAVGILFYLYGDPSSVHGSFDSPEKNFLMLCGIFTLIGVIFFFTGLAFLIGEIKNRKAKKMLLQTGERIFARVVDVRENYFVTINHRHPLYFICEYEDPYTMNVEQFKSECFSMDLTGLIGSTVAVYVDRADHSKYVVDLSAPSIGVRY
ncbi:MAG: DUF3592 domain-containing protein [Lachnospiraceae bacterium]|nr:DUF3592 domain-containing protein [Lachnospiraceae bacterium]